MKLRKKLQEFVVLQEKVLQHNDSRKGFEGWKNVSNRRLFYLLKLEVEELHAALINEHSNNIKYECADIANFAMMIASNNWNK